MVNQDQFRSAAKLAVNNIIKFGDTDIFPFPFENHIFFDLGEEITNLIVEYDNNFDQYLNSYPPTNVSSLIPVSSTGFRWGTQLDPIWNAHFLASVLSISEKIEASRLPKDSVYSYRVKKNKKSYEIFDSDLGWVQFMKASIELSEVYEFVTSCDVSEFYPRINHHRLENALKHVAGDTPYPYRIMSFLSNFSNTNSYGLPIGGPAARILSELTINQIDKLLLSSGVKFVRFADDFHLFTKSREEAYRALVFLSEKLYVNQGLTLQKSKTRIMSSAEFRATNPVRDLKSQGEIQQEGEEAASRHSRNRLLQFSLRFDPYSPNAEEDYERLKSEIAKFDVIGLLKSELAKSRVHIALSKKLVSAIKFLEGKTRSDAILSLLENSDLLYPIYSSVLLMTHSVYDDLHDDTKGKIIERLCSMIKSESHVFKIDSHLSFAIRVLSLKYTPEVEQLFNDIYQRTDSISVKRDIILSMARWELWYWLSDQKNNFRNMTGPQRRAFIAASYGLADEGKHWRDHLKSEFSPFEEIVRKWSADKASINGWRLPL